MITISILPASAPSGKSNKSCTSLRYSGGVKPAFAVALALPLLLQPLLAQTDVPGNKGYYRYPAIHGDTVVFTSEGDLSTVPTFPPSRTDFPIIWLSVSPVSLPPSTLKVKVRSMGPFGPSGVPFHLPPISVAKAEMDMVTIRNRERRSFFMHPLFRGSERFSRVAMFEQLQQAEIAPENLC